VARNGEKTNACRPLVGNLEEKSHLKDLGLGEKIILR
jgi:hypothetical protein